MGKKYCAKVMSMIGRRQSIKEIRKIFPDSSRDTQRNYERINYVKGSIICNFVDDVWKLDKNRITK